ncbi:protein of unknown function [Tenacibaculum sp. 190524A02b]|uniref:hypothetical protein n=1 Tax=Tenacibaculum vairaonense TaxID=3137860 RepID=UPI0032B17AFF
MEVADVFLNTITIRVNTHDLLGVPSDESQKEFFDAVWNEDFGEWKINSSEMTHYEVFDFSFERKEQVFDGIDTLKKRILELAIKHLKNL